MPDRRLDMHRRQFNRHLAGDPPRRQFDRQRLESRDPDPDPVSQRRS